MEERGEKSEYRYYELEHIFLEMHLRARALIELIFLGCMEERGKKTEYRCYELEHLFLEMHFRARALILAS